MDLTSSNSQFCLIDHLKITVHIKIYRFWLTLRKEWIRLREKVQICFPLPKTGQDLSVEMLRDWNYLFVLLRKNLPYLLAPRQFCITSHFFQWICIHVSRKATHGYNCTKYEINIPPGNAKLGRISNWGIYKTLKWLSKE